MNNPTKAPRLIHQNIEDTFIRGPYQYKFTRKGPTKQGMHALSLRLSTMGNGHNSTLGSKACTHSLFR